jgi:hypothetical protein
VKNLLASFSIEYMPASRKKKKMPGIVIPEVETESPPLAAMPEEA